MAYKWLKKAADENNPEAQYNLGEMYYNGFHVSQNYTETIKWYKRAAEQNIPIAKYNLGNMYLNGEGVKPNIKKAMSFLISAAELNNKDAQFKYKVRGKDFFIDTFIDV